MLFEQNRLYHDEAIAWTILCDLYNETNDCYALLMTFKVVSKDKIGLLNWSLVDVHHQKFYQHSRLDPRAPEIILNESGEANVHHDNTIRAAFRELLAKNRVPLPNTIAATTASIEQPYGFSFDEDSLQTESNILRINLHQSDISCKLNITLNENLVSLTNDEDLINSSNQVYKRSLTLNCSAEGKLNIADRESQVTSKTCVFIQDSFQSDMTKKKVHYGLTQLFFEKNSALYFIHQLEDLNNMKQLQTRVFVIKEGKIKIYNDVKLTANTEKKSLWRSTKSLNLYPTEWNLTIPSLNLVLPFKAEIPNQEVMTLTKASLFLWSGIVSSKGITGFLSREGYETILTAQDFFDAVSDETYQQISDLIPLHPSRKEWQHILADELDENELNDIDLEELSRNLIAPLREITDRKGKAWRSYMIMACCNMVGGDFNLYLPLLTVEIIHTGSLIVDDVEDNSLLRRGKKACHLIYGIPIAINAGDAAYFWPQLAFKKIFKHLPAEKVNRVYEYYFDTMHIAHAGQAIDISGFETIVDDVIAGRAKPDLLERRVRVLHYLKSGNPFEFLSGRIGALVGGGTDKEITLLGSYVACLGMAFQIIDDVINLLGCKYNSKVQGEDIMEGKITYPIAIAAKLLAHEDYLQLLNDIKKKPQDKNEIQRIIDILKNCGAIEESKSIAKKIVCEKWSEVDAAIPDTFEKMMLHVFSRYLIERHY